MAKKMMDKLKSKIGIAQKDAKNAPASAPGKMRQIVGETCAVYSTRTSSGFAVIGAGIFKYAFRFSVYCVCGSFNLIAFRSTAFVPLKIRSPRTLCF